MAMREVPLFIVSQSRARNPSRGAPRYRISLIKESGSVYVTSKPISTAEDVFNVSRRFFEDADREAFYVLCLDNKSKIIGVNLVSTGTLSASLVHPREVFKAAILLNSATIISVHNHPSGDPTPSVHDRDLTQRLVDAGVIMGIALKDHVVVADDGFFSFSEQGVLPSTSCQRFR